MPSSKGSWKEDPRDLPNSDWNQVSRIASRFFTIWTTREACVNTKAVIVRAVTQISLTGAWWQVKVPPQARTSPGVRLTWTHTPQLAVFPAHCPGWQPPPERQLLPVSAVQWPLRGELPPWASRAPSLESRGLPWSRGKRRLNRVPGVKRMPWPVPFCLGVLKTTTKPTQILLLSKQN